MGNPRIFLSPPDVGEAEEQRARDAIRSGWVAPIGPDLEEFEEALASLSERKFAIGVSSGTAALQLGLLALGVRPGDAVICSTLTFVATANAISYVGAIPVFVDSESLTGNLSPGLLAEAIEDLLASGHRIGAVVPVDFLGCLANYQEIIPVCAKYRIPVLADSAESVGSARLGRPAGSFGEAAIFSFNGNKIVTTSGGGAFLTDRGEYANIVRHLSTQAREPARHYEHHVIGYNFRMSNVLASIGNAQLGRLGEMMARRRYNRARYRDLFESIPGVSVLGTADFEDNCWLTAIVVDQEVSGFSANQLADFLESQNIESRPLWKPMHLQPLYRGFRAYLGGFAEHLFLRGLALPSGSSLREPEWERISGAIETFLESLA